MDQWYFAFDDNMSTRRMRRIVGAWKDARRATLKGYAVGFFSYSQRWGCGVLDLEERDGGIVVGVAYLLGEEGVAAMDRYQGVPTISRKMHVKVEAEGMGEVEAYTYVLVDRRRYVQPSKAYLDAVISGLREWGYLQQVEEVLRLARGLGQ